MFKNLIVDRMKALTMGPSAKYFRVEERENGVFVMRQPWGRGKIISWAKAEKMLDLVPMRKGPASETSARIVKRRAG